MKSFLKNTGRCVAAFLAAATLLPMVAQAQAPTPFGAVPNARQIEWYHRERENFLHSIWPPLPIRNGRTGPQTRRASIRRRSTADNG